MCLTDWHVMRSAGYRGGAAQAHGYRGIEGIRGRRCASAAAPAAAPLPHCLRLKRSGTKRNGPSSGGKSVGCSGSSRALEGCRMPAQAPSVACTLPWTRLSCGGGRQAGRKQGSWSWDVHEPPSSCSKRRAAWGTAGRCGPSRRRACFVKRSPPHAGRQPANLQYCHPWQPRRLTGWALPTPSRRPASPCLAFPHPPPKQHHTPNPASPALPGAPPRLPAARARARPPRWRPPAPHARAPRPTRRPRTVPRCRQ